ncbi:hypothetical protein AABB24_013917 [Solanum stoloniferum]|uniref:Uncharacterized protein n=1 Tax=Solanum stoloniferum TaxID=62892 RepID=A0ABD2TW92_9SOLN
MMRIRLVWFTIGFTSASAAMSQFIFRDLWAHQLSLSSQLEEKFGVLGTRVSNLELALHDTPNTQQVIVVDPHSAELDNLSGAPRRGMRMRTTPKKLIDYVVTGANHLKGNTSTES